MKLFEVIASYDFPTLKTNEYDVFDEFKLIISMS